MKKKYGIILGSGLSLFSEKLKNKKLVFENSAGIHHKKSYKGRMFDNLVCIFDGRNHIYENSPYEKLFFNIEYAKEEGINSLIITNASGGINTNFNVSDLMVINSYINLQFKYLQSKNYKFNMDYCKNAVIQNLCLKKNINLHSGVYCSSSGPAYETVKEIEFLKKYVKADAVGMSTVPEIMIANKYKINVVAISCITNILKPFSFNKVSHNEVIEAGKNSFEIFSKVINLIIENNL